MRATTLGCLAAGLLAACGDGVPPARYEVFTLELVGLVEGERVFPGQQLTYRTTYSGDLVRNLQWEATFTHEASGERASVRWSDVPRDTASIAQSGRFTLRHELLERAGPVRVQLRASVTATRTGSAPWEARSQSVFVDLHPSLDALDVSLPAEAPLPYATPIAYQVTGRDLWGPVEVTVVDLDAGAPVAELEQALPFDGTQASLGGSWTLRARALERVGTRRVQLVARYGELELRSEPIAFSVTHTLDEVTPLVRTAGGALVTPSLPHPRLGDATELVLRIAGTQLAGHEVTVNGGAPTVAPGDRFDLVVHAPSEEDFGDGEGWRTYELVARSGGTERSASVTLQRWGIEGCGWRTPDGAALPDGARVALGAQVYLEARLWGFPDTTTRWFLFRSPLAEFTLWEADPGGRAQPGDLFENNDDEVDSFDAEIRSGLTERGWTTEHEDEVDPLDLNLNAAEYYFEVKVEDQRCTSGQLVVPSD
jgi:hypothetical protein